MISKSVAMYTGSRFLTPVQDVINLELEVFTDPHLSTRTIITFTLRGRELNFPEEELFTFTWEDVAYTIKARLRSMDVLQDEVTYTYIAYNAPLTGVATLKKVRFELGDGTYRQLYCHAKEFGSVIERLILDTKK